MSRIYKWLALAGAVIAVVATIAYLRRDSLAMDIANSMLGEQDFVVTDLSVDTFTATRLDLAELVIESGGGTRYVVYGLQLPLSLGGSGGGRITADRVLVVFDPERTERSSLTSAIEKLLELSSGRAIMSAEVGRVVLPDFPELANARWQTTGDGQSVSFDLGKIEVSARIQSRDQATQRLTINARQGTEVLAAEAALTPGDLSVIHATARLRLAAWRPLFKRIGALPDGFEDVDAEIDARMVVRLDDEALGNATVVAPLSLAGPLAATYRSASGLETDIALQGANNLVFTYRYPQREWAVHASSASATVSTDDVANLPVEISALECRSGVYCTLQAGIDAQNVAWRDFTFDTVNASSPVTVNSGEEIKVGIAANARAELHGMRTDGLEIDAIAVHEFSGAMLTIDDAGWEAHIDRLDLGVSRAKAGETFIVSTPVTLRDLNIGDSGETADAQLDSPAEVDAEWNGLALRIPGGHGVFSLDGTEFVTLLSIADPGDSMSARIQLRRDLDTGDGSLIVREARLVLDDTRLSDRAPHWKNRWDIVRGSVSGDASLEWQTKADATEYSGALNLALEGLGGTWRDTALVGLDTRLEATFGSDTGITLAPASVAIRLLEIGLPVEDIHFDYSVEDDAIAVQDLTMSVLGGQLQARPFRYTLGDKSSDMTLYVHDIQLQLMVDALDFESIEMSGSVSGTLPVKISDNRITIASGQLESSEPGVIRYHSDEGTLDAVATDDGVGVVLQSLTNFEFDSLAADVNYTDAGDLLLQMRLEGVNPDYDATQPIILNLGVENNVPQLLRSLQAIRSIEDILEQRTAN